MKTHPTLFAAPSSTKLGHHGQTIREMTGGNCSIIKLGRSSTSLLKLFVEYSGTWPQFRVVHITVGKELGQLVTSVFISEVLDICGLCGGSRCIYNAMAMTMVYI